MPTPTPLPDWNVLRRKAYVVLVRCGLRRDADDLAGQTMVILHRDYGHKPMAELDKLVATIARNVAHATARDAERQRLARALDATPLLRPAAGNGDGDVDGVEELPRDDVCARERVRAALRALRAQKPYYYDALCLQHYYGLEQGEIAEVLSATVDDVNNWQKRGRSLFLSAAEPQPTRRQGGRSAARPRVVSRKS